jgi:hypothetical protein
MRVSKSCAGSVIRMELIAILYDLHEIASLAAIVMRPASFARMPNACHAGGCAGSKQSRA